MVIFHSYVKLPEGNHLEKHEFVNGKDIPYIMENKTCSKPPTSSCLYHNCLFGAGSLIFPPCFSFIQLTTQQCVSTLLLQADQITDRWATHWYTRGESGLIFCAWIYSLLSFPSDPHGVFEVTAAQIPRCLGPIQMVRALPHCLCRNLKFLEGPPIKIQLQFQLLMHQLQLESAQCHCTIVVCLIFGCTSFD